MKTIFGQKLLSVLCLVSLANGLPAENKNRQTSEMADESRHFSRYEDSGFVPIIPPSLNPHPAISLHSDPRINPTIQASHYRNGYVSTSRPFSLRHISSTSTINRLTPSTQRPSTLYDQALLGSGDFDVLRGGTFYPEGEDRRTEHFGSESIFLDTNTGRPFALPLDQPHYSDDPFAHFKDFADITAGVDSDFTNVVVIYANKNSTRHEPRNILEQLQLLDQQKEQTEVSASQPINKSIKLSKFKAKLQSTKTSKKYEKAQVPKKLKETKTSTSSSSVDYVDPLVADS